MNSGAYQQAYARLNAKQKMAVDTIDGPLLVIAGPGTGKTQLLSTRAAHIVAQGNINPSNILCLTYTETGASEMRNRMANIMGIAGSEVAVHTFHSFGRTLIGRYPELFSKERSLTPLDDLSHFSLLESLLSKLPFRHALAIRDENERFIRQHAVEEAIRAFKQAGMTPAELRTVLKQNAAEYELLQPLIEEIFATTLSMKRLDQIEADVVAHLQNTTPHSYSAVLLAGLEEAIQTSHASGKTASLGKWRDRHTTIKNKTRVLKSAAQNKLLHDTVNLYDSYQKALVTNGRYDYEDMVLWAAQAMETHDDMRLDIAEQFQYIMVDEYQDTNGAQNRLLDSILGANPLNSPNVMVVGDDDQAIMRFQGAEISGMLKFVETYQPKMIVLDKNYRSGQPILDASRAVMMQTNDRLEVSLPKLTLTKQLTAMAKHTQTTITHTIYDSQTAEYQAVATYVQQQIKAGVKPSEIGIIGRKHSELAQCVPYLSALHIDIQYDRRENILAHPAITQLLDLARCVIAIANDPARAQYALPDVLAASYWKITPLELYQLASESRSKGEAWLDVMLAHSEKQWPMIAEWLIAAAQSSKEHNFTRMLDILIGREPIKHTALEFSPYRNLYRDQTPEIYTTILAHLICIRNAVLQHNPSARSLADMLDVANQYQHSGLHLVDENPLLRGSSDSVQVMSAHGAKGREFEHVIILSAVDEIWGNRARSNNQRISLPENLPLYPAGDTESDRLRLLYVAMTRTKSHLLLTSYHQTDEGKAATPLGYLSLGDEPNGWWQGKPKALDTKQILQALETSWQPTGANKRTLRQILEPHTRNFRLSPSALRDFLDFRYNGPLASIEKHILRFPSAYNAHSALGSTTHKVLQRAQAAYADGSPMTSKQALTLFDELLEQSGLQDGELQSVREHAHQFLPIFLAHCQGKVFAYITETEKQLFAESPNLAVPLSGAIDALATNHKGIRIIDYKTGRPPLPDWKTSGLSDSKKVSLHFYRQQLLFYKLLVDNSPAHQDNQPVAQAELIFVEPSDDPEHEFISLDITEFDDVELARLEKLMQIIYTRIVNADLPDTSRYPHSLKGILAFEEDLLAS